MSNQFARSECNDWAVNFLCLYSRVDEPKTSSPKLLAECKGLLLLPSCLWIDICEALTSCIAGQSSWRRRAKKTPAQSSRQNAKNCLCCQPSCGSAAVKPSMLASRWDLIRGLYFPPPWAFHCPLAHQPSRAHLLHYLGSGLHACCLTQTPLFAPQAGFACTGSFLRNTEYLTSKPFNPGPAPPS